MPTEEITIEDLVNWYCEYYNIELWKDIEGYEGLYQVSNTGKVKSLERKVKKWDGERTIPERILKPKVSKSGYIDVTLCKNNTHQTFRLHRLVAQAWVPNPHNYTDVNHIDECKTSNNAANLEWCNASYNCNFGGRNERLSKSMTNRVKQSKPIVQYTLDGIVVAEYPSTHEVERQTGFNNANIGKCCNGTYKQCYGYVWKYKGEAV